MGTEKRGVSERIKLKQTKDWEQEYISTYVIIRRKSQKEEENN